MIQDRIEKLEAAVNGTSTLSAGQREELLRLLSDLKAEVTPLHGTNAEDARSITDFATASVHAATRQEKRPVLANAALTGLSASVEGFEASHPKLVQIVDRIALVLSNMGI